MLDPMSHAIPLNVTEKIPTPAELQNSRGRMSGHVEGLTPGNYLTILAVETKAALTPEQFFALRQVLQSDFEVVELQTMFGDTVPDIPGNRPDLHVSAQIRLEEIRTEE
jgi:hypothetical protein